MVVCLCVCVFVGWFVCQCGVSVCVWSSSCLMFCGLLLLFVMDCLSLCVFFVVMHSVSKCV